MLDERNKLKYELKIAYNNYDVKLSWVKSTKQEKFFGKSILNELLFLEFEQSFVARYIYNRQRHSAHFRNDFCVSFNSV